MYIKMMTRDNESAITHTTKYAKDEEKCTVAISIEEYSQMLQTQTEDDTLHRTLTYTTNKNKTINHQYVTGYLCNPENAEMNFKLNIKRVCQLSGKEAKDIQLYHWVQSFHELIDIPHWEVNQIGVETLRKIGNDKYMGLVCSHVIPEKDDHTGEIMGGACLHNHMVMPAYMFHEFVEPGQKKVKFSRTLDYARRCNDHVMLAHGLPIIIESSQDNLYYTVSPDFIKESWKSEFKKDVEEAKNNARLFKSFTSILEAKGYTVSKGKNTTLLSKDGHQITLERLSNTLSTKQIKKLYSVKAQIKTAKKEKKGSYKTKELEKIIDEHGTDLYVQLVQKIKPKKGEEQKPDDEEKHYKLAFNLNSEKYKMLFDAFEIKKDEAYEILIQKKKECKAKTTDEEYESIEYESVGVVTGEDLYHFHDLKIEKEKEQVIKDILNDFYEYGYDNFDIIDYEDKKGKQRKGFCNRRYVNYKTNKPYTYDFFDNYAYRRSNLELILILIMLLLNPDRYRYQKTSSNDVIYARRDPKLQRMINGVSIVKKENIRSFRDLEERLKKAGARIGFIKRAISNNENILNEMKLIKASIEYLDSYDSVSDNKIDERKKVKAFLHSKNINTVADKHDFLNRYESIKKNIANYKTDLDEAKEQYKTLKYLEETMQLANNEKYVLGRDYNYEKAKGKELSLDEQILGTNYNNNAVDVATHGHVHVHDNDHIK